MGGGAAGSWAIDNRSGNMIQNRYPLGFKVQLHRKDLTIALAVAREMGVSRNTVRKYLTAPEPRRREPEARPRPVLRRADR
mgnify:CR=1 FL=1